ncbi:MAG: 5-(carboxyamino)imidazole ribonucleotide synthase [Sphingomonadales bacterium]|nr:5-(carboxyamino)imidazole ribonucleotide synthase [Sphingomonadales bacterium]
MIPPGETIGILGGGQLGRMLAMAAAQLGYRCHIYAPEPESIAAEVSAAFTCAAWDDAEAMARFAADCAVVTYEFENVPVAPLSALGAVPLLAHPRALETAQDRLTEKRFIEALGGRPAPYAPVDGASDLAGAVAGIGTPGILKTRRDGYDGKGQWRIMAAGDAQAIDLPATPLIYEGFVNFDAEFSVLLCRGQDGDIRFWDTPDNVHQGGILARSTVPACALVQAQLAEARRLATKVAAALDYVGVLTLEFFATVDGPVFNEMAPRVHNSGHWTIEGALTSQFENHVRAICGLPLGDTALAAKGVEMRNIIGDAAEDWALLLGDPCNHLHLYGKAAARPGRKMGHVTRLTLA